MQETQVRSLGWDDPLEKEMVTHSSILAWRIPMDRGAWRATVQRVSESNTTKHRAHDSLNAHLAELCFISDYSGCKKFSILAWPTVLKVDKFEKIISEYHNDVIWRGRKWTQGSRPKSKVPGCFSPLTTKLYDNEFHQFSEILQLSHLLNKCWQGKLVFMFAKGATSSKILWTNKASLFFYRFSVP